MGGHTLAGTCRGYGIKGRQKKGDKGRLEKWNDGMMLNNWNSGKME